jgi:hypothetical protein
MRKKFIPLLCIFLIAGINAGAQNLLKNGNFEESKPDGTTVSNGWQIGWYPAEAGSITTSTAAMAGKCGLWLYTALSDDLAFSRPFQEIRCTPGAKYKAGAYFRTPKNENWISGSVVNISLTFKSAAGVTITTVESDKLTTKNSDWKLFSIDAVAPEKAALVRYTINLESRKGQSICNADNCSLVIVR